MSGDDDEVAYTLTQLPQVHVFKIPARKSSEGYRAADWPKEPSWTGKLRVVGKGKIASIILYDDKNPSFAVCKVTDDTCIEKTLDSGRYFVLKITNAQGRHAFIGIAFNERNDSFDFNVALSEFRSQVEREEQAEKGVGSIAAPMMDLKLKEGEKIKIKINKKTTDEDGQPIARSPIKPLSAPGAGGLLLPPPKKGNLAGFAASPAKPVVAAAAPAAAASTDPFGASDPFGEDPFGTFATAPAAATTAAASTAGAVNSAFTFAPSTGADGGFGTDPFGAAAPAATAKPASDEVNLLDM
jgi:adaptin ear-binding coat-associated protein 1/2